MTPVLITIGTYLVFSLTTTFTYYLEKRRVLLIADAFMKKVSDETIKEVEKITVDRCNLLNANNSLATNLNIQSKEIEKLKKLEKDLTDKLNTKQVVEFKTAKEKNMESYVYELQFIRDRYAQKSEKILINSLIGRLKKEYVNK